jgi:hypothetical protein
LENSSLRLNEDIKEVPVWGIDCFTRRMVEMAIEDRVPSAQRSSLIIAAFIEKKLLPAINAQRSESAHNMTFALQFILEVSSFVPFSYVWI